MSPKLQRRKNVQQPNIPASQQIRRPKHSAPMPQQHPGRRGGRGGGVIQLTPKRARISEDVVFVWGRIQREGKSRNFRADEARFFPALGIQRTPMQRKLDMYSSLTRHELDTKATPIRYQCDTDSIQFRHQFDANSTPIERHFDANSTLLRCPLSKVDGEECLHQSAPNASSMVVP